MAGLLDALEKNDLLSLWKFSYDIISTTFLENKENESERVLWFDDLSRK